MKTILLLLAIIFFGCTKEQTTGINYNNVMPRTTKVEIYHNGDLLETVYLKAETQMLVELPPGEIKTEYTPEGCWRVLPDAVILEEGEVLTEKLWFQMPLWN